MKKFLLTFALALAALSAGAQRSYAEYVEEAGSAPFIVVDKTALTLALVDAQGKAIKEYGISVAVNRDPSRLPATTRPRKESSGSMNCSMPRG